MILLMCLGTLLFAGGRYCTESANGTFNSLFYCKGGDSWIFLWNTMDDLLMCLRTNKADEGEERGE